MPESRKDAAVSRWSEQIGYYLLSLPERVVRSASALAGGLLRELSDVTIPEAARRSRLYRTMVEATLRFLIEQVGQVEGTFPDEGQLVRNFVLRRTAGNGIEMLGILAFRASPVWVLAVLADLSGAGRHVVREIAGSLREEGLLSGEGKFETVDQILDGLERGAGRLAEAVNTPPLDVAGLREEWNSIRDEVASIPVPNLPTADSIGSRWQEIRTAARAQRRSTFEISSLMAIAAVGRLPENTVRLSRGISTAARRTGGLFAGVLLDHYRLTLTEIRTTGFFRYWSREFRPYLKAAAEQFSLDRRSLTAELLRRASE